MTDLFLDLLTRSLSASILVLIVVLLRFALKKAPKWMICALWALVAIRLVCPVAMFSSFSLIPQEISSGDAVGELEDIYSGNIMVIGDDDPIFQAAVDAGRKPKYAGQLEGRDYYTVTTAGDGISEPTTLASKLSGCWLIGMSVMAVYAAVSYLLIRRKITASVRLRDNIFLCDYIESPFILGVVKPRIYLPSAMDQSQWPHVIAHEKAHLHRKDHWWKPLGFALLCVYWFNPVLWLAYILLCKDIELACDERVIRDMDIQQKKDYTSALLECSMPRYLIAACPLAFGEVGIEDRVKSVLNYKKPAFWIILIALVLCIAAAVCFLTDPMDNNVITPGVYDIDTTLYLWPNPNGGSIPTVPEGQYTLHNQTLYVDNGNSVTALGRMTPYDLDNFELSEYIRNNDYWQLQFYSVPTISEALWLRMEDDSFYVWFQTNNGETFLGRGIEDYGERHDWFDDDTRITQLCRMTYQESAVVDDLAWFSGTVVEVSDSYIVVESAPGTEESNLFDRIYVSMHVYFGGTNGEPVGNGVLTGMNVGDRVRVVYDGEITGSGVPWIRLPMGVEKLPATADQYSVTSGSSQVIPLRLPVNTDIETVAGIPLLVLEKNDYGLYRFQILRDGAEHPGVLRLYDYQTREEIKGFGYLGNNAGPDWSLLEPGHNYIVTQEHNAMVCFAVAVPHDFGITLSGSNITPTGMTVTCTQSGGTCPGEITYDPNAYTLRRITDFGWENVPCLSSFASFTSQQIETLQKDTTVTWDIDWSQKYGTLEPGNYRFDRYFRHGDPLQDYVYFSVYFTIGDDGAVCQFSATVLDVNNGSILVQPLPGSQDHPGMDPLWVTRTLADSGEYVQDIAIGDTVAIFYDGLIAETYPGQIGTVYNIQILPERSVDPTEPASPYITVEVSNATATEALIVCHINGSGDTEVWTGYEYWLEVLTDSGWVHYGYRSHQLAWEDALLFHVSDQDSEELQHTEVFLADWSRTSNAPLPSGTYRYCKDITIKSGGTTQTNTCYAEFTIPEGYPEDWGLHLEILNPTPTGATLALTYNGGLIGELSTSGQYYMMVNVGNDAMTRYGMVPSQVDWDDASYPLLAGETVYLDVRWDHTADAPLPPGIYYVVLAIDHNIPYNGTESRFHHTKYVTESFAVTD